MPKLMNRYLDEYPYLIGEKWEERMDAMGHEVTAHINEQGTCDRCEAMLNAVLMKAQSDDEFRAHMSKALDEIFRRQSLQDILKRWGNGTLFT